MIFKGKTGGPTHLINLISITFVFFFSGTFDYDPELGTCSIVPDQNGNSAKTALFVIAFIVPAMLIFICYARIFWVVHR